MAKTLIPQKDKKILINNNLISLEAMNE